MEQITARFRRADLPERIAKTQDAQQVDEIDRVYQGAAALATVV